MGYKTVNLFEIYHLTLPVQLSIARHERILVERGLIK